MTRLDDALARLVDRGVLTTEQARAVRAEVGDDAGDDAGGAGADRPRGAARRTSTVSPAAEIGGYLGGALTLVAVLFLVGERLDDAHPLVAAFLLGVMAAVFVAAGFAIRDPSGRDGVRWRLTGTLWALGVLLTGFAAAAALHVDRSEGTALTLSGAAALALAAVLYRVQRSAVQVVALVLAGVVTVIGIAQLADWDGAGGGVALAVFGGAVMLAGVARVLEPDAASVPLGGAVVLIALQIVAFDDDWRRLTLLAMLAAAVGMFVLSARTGVVLSGVATLGVTAALPQAIHEFGGGNAPLPVVLLVAGLTLLGGAALTARTRR